MRNAAAPLAAGILGLLTSLASGLALVPRVRLVEVLALVPWKRDVLHKSRSAAPGSQGATTAHIEHM
jgi:hypothetical protein